MSVTIDELNPYLSVVILKIADNTFNINSLKENLSLSRYRFKTEEYDGGNIFYSHYKEEKQASWTTNESVKDISNHVLIIFKFDSYLALYHSDNAKKNKIYSLIFRGPSGHEFKKLRLVRKEVFNSAFLSNVKIKNLWLNNIGNQSDVNADTKVLSGSNLEHALDPIGDQMYNFSAIKVENTNIDLSIGINSSYSKLWIKKYANSTEYFDVLKIILEEIKEKDTSPNPLLHHPVSILANSHTEYTLLSQMIDIQLNSCELFSIDSEEYEILSSISSLWDNCNFEFNLINNLYQIKILDSSNNEKIAEFRLFFSKKDECIRFNVIGSSEYDSNLLKALEHKGLVKYWFLDDQMISNGLIYKKSYRDVIYNGFEWCDFTNYLVKKEKPIDDDFSLIGDPQDKSLFSWVKNNWNGTSLDDLVDYNQSFVKGWLLCDDGAGEKADFIHVTDEDNPTISLIHAKGANTNSNGRQIAPTAYEVVVSQSIKNIRYLDKTSISETITSAPNSNVENLVWLNGVVSTRDSFKNYLDGLTQYKKRVVILQPHVTNTKYNLNNPSDSQKLKTNLLSSLLLSAQNTVNSLGAEFVVIGDNI
jgi:hypothetical protein